MLQSSELIFTSSNYPITVNLSNNEIDTIFIQDLEVQVKSQCNPPPCTENTALNRGETVFHLRNNPIRCDCGAFHLANYMQHKMFPVVYKYVSIKPEQVICHWPDSLMNVSLSEIDLRDLQCALDLVHPEQNRNCPLDCHCLYRPMDKSVIVDCSRRGMTKFPQQVPMLADSSVELLFAGNNMNSLNGLSNLSAIVNVTKLSLSFNKLTNVDDLEIPENLKVRSSRYNP